MKKINRYMLFLLLLGLMACKDDIEPIFEESYEQFISVKADSTKAILASSEYGWLCYYSSTPSLMAAPIAMKFNIDGTVKIKAYANPKTGFQGNLTTSTYGIDVQQTVNLVFESASIFSYYNNLLVSTSNGGTTLLGGGEFQFIIESASENMIKLRSLTDKGNTITKINLFPARESDWKFNEAEIVKMDSLYVNASEIMATKGYFRNLTVPTYNFKSYMTYFRETKAMYFTYSVGDSVVTTRHRVGVNDKGFHLIDPLEVSKGKYAYDFIFNLGTREFRSVDFNGAKISQSNAPALEYFKFVNDWGQANDSLQDSRMDYPVKNAYINYNSPKFGSLASSIADLQHINFYVNNKLNTSRSTEAINFQYNIAVKGVRQTINVDIPIKLIRNNSQTLIFQAESNAFDNAFDNHKNPNAKSINKEQAREMFKILTNSKGFYPVESTLYSGDKPFATVMMVSAEDSDYRFITEFFIHNTIGPIK